MMVARTDILTGFIMDKIPLNSINMEKTYFLSKLKSNPLFALKHLPALSHIIWRRYQIKYLQRFRRKKNLPWLKNLSSIGNLQADKYPWLSLLARDLPAKRLILPASTRHAYFANDHEDYLAKYRFGELINYIFAHHFILPEAIKEWLDKPPPKLDPAWETYSCCERIANFITWASFIPKEQRLQKIPKNALPFLEKQLNWIISHLEYHKQYTGNHILNNARALLMGGALLQHAQALKNGMGILKYMLPILIQPQGALREGSTHYQLIVLKWLLDAYTFAQASGVFNHADLAFIQQYILKMQKVAAIFCDEAGELQAFIGDISPDAKPQITTTTLMLCYPVYWPPKFTKASYYHYDDWLALYQGKQKVLLNCPQGKYPQHIATHKHNDLSSFVWLFDNQPLLIDTGRARYTKDKLTSLQKSATGHNVALVNDMAPLCESIIINGHWCPKPYANAAIKLETLQQNEMMLTHNGFKRATSVEHHTRHIKLLQDSLQIIDRFRGKGTVDIKLIWQLHQSFKKQSGELIHFTNDQYDLIIKISADCTPQVQVIHAHESLGWHSTQYGSASRHPVLIMHWQTHLPFQTVVSFKVQSCVA